MVNEKDILERRRILLMIIREKKKLSPLLNFFQKKIESSPSQKMCYIIKYYTKSKTKNTHTSHITTLLEEKEFEENSYF